MLPEQRRRQLLEYLKQNGGAHVPDLSAGLEVSTATIRRDLQHLEEHGHIKRTHGGAVLPHVSTAFEPLYWEKKEKQLAEKRAIAKLASKHVQDGEVVILDSGSTTLALAMELKRRHGLTIITSDLKIALELSDVPSFEVVIIGGKVRSQLYSVIGPIAEQTLRELHANCAFLGADAISLEAGVTNANLDEVAIKRLIIASCRKPILIADHTKFGKVTLAKVSDLAVFSEVICDWQLDPLVANHLIDEGINLSLAEKEH